MPRAPETAPARLRENRRRYDQVVEVVRSRAARGDLEGVLRGATVAANHAWRAPVGVLNDPALERLVITACRGDGPPPVVDGTRTAGRVLHVLSEGYDLGGHTRLVWRWMERDSRTSDVVLTNQFHPVPERLRQGVATAGGRVFDLRRDHPAFAARVEALRDLMERADLVVHHVHPYDAVALAAAALPGPRPPVVYENHADFTFWLGLGSTDVLADHRARSAMLSRELRGFAPRRLGLLPLPVEDTAAPAGDREQLRRSLGVRPDDVVALSVAAPPKMLPVWGRGFDDLLATVLTAHPRLTVVLVGPAAEGPWAGLAARFPGRLFPAGYLLDPAPWYGAADLYLNPYPLPGGTSVLEAALAGMPVVSLRDVAERHGHAAVFQADSPGLADVRHAATTDDQYLTRLRKLVRDPALRAREGAVARRAVLAEHTGEGWTRRLEALYEQARGVPAADLDEYPTPEPDLGYGGMLVAFVSPGSSPDTASAASVLGPDPDPTVLADLFAVANRESGPSLAVRIAAGWEAHPAWTTRLLALAGEHPRLAVSLPFAAGDDDHGTASVTRLTGLLAALGQDLDHCGDITLDVVAPTVPGPSVSGELPHDDDALDWLEMLLSSPCWSAREGELATAP